MGLSCSYPVQINRQYPTDRHRCRCQAVTTVREAFSSRFPFSQRVRSMNSVSFAMLRAKKAKIQKFETLCHKICLVRFGVSCRCQKSRRRTSNSFCVLLPCLALVQCLAGVGTFVQLSSSDQSSVPNRQAQMQVSSSDHCERTIHVTWQRVRSMNSVSFAMLRAEKAGVFQTPQTL